MKHKHTYTYTNTHKTLYRATYAKIMYELQASPFPPCSITSLLVSVRIGKVPHAVEH